jgi:hypothetical protein
MMEDFQRRIAISDANDKHMDSIERLLWRGLEVSFIVNIFPLENYACGSINIPNILVGIFAGNIVPPIPQEMESGVYDSFCRGSSSWRVSIIPKFVRDVQNEARIGPNYLHGTQLYFRHANPRTSLSIYRVSRYAVCFSRGTPLQKGNRSINTGCDDRPLRPLHYRVLSAIFAILVFIYLLVIGDKNWKPFWDGLIFTAGFLCGMYGFGMLFYCVTQFFEGATERTQFYSQSKDTHGPNTVTQKYDLTSHNYCNTLLAVGRAHMANVLNTDKQIAVIIQGFRERGEN